MNDISNMRFHGLEYEKWKGIKDNNIVQRDEKAIEHGLEKGLKITHIPDSPVHLQSQHYL